MEYMKRQLIEETKYFFNEYLKSKGLETFEDFEIFCDKMMWDEKIKGLWALYKDFSKKEEHKFFKDRAISFQHIYPMKRLCVDDYIDVTLISCIVKDKIECVDD